MLPLVIPHCMRIFIIAALNCATAFLKDLNIVFWLREYSLICNCINWKDAFLSHFSSDLLYLI